MDHQWPRRLPRRSAGHRLARELRGGEIGYARPRSWTLGLAAGIGLGCAFKLLMKAVVMPLLDAPAINPTYHYFMGIRVADARVCCFLSRPRRGFRDRLAASYNEPASGVLRRAHLSGNLNTMDHRTKRNLVRTRRRALSCAALLAATALASACGSGRAGPPGGGPPATPVEVVTLVERPVEQTTEFVGTVKSRRSTTVQPQVEGFVTRILVRSGDRVGAGTALMEIDPRMQEAAVANLESQRAARQADLQHAQRQATRMKTLLDAGAASQAEMEQAQNALSTARAQLDATEAQIREQRVALAYHTVSAPVAGIVGDVPVRVGDRVTRSTELTTIDQNLGLELYVNVPVQEAGNLRVGLPVHLVDDGGKVLATERLSFVSSSVDPATQSVLAKANIERAAGLRTEQFARARVVWTSAPALTVPIVALNRVNAQFFAYVAESGEGGKTVARQRAVEPGAVVGNDYVVKSGLKPGEKLIVSGVQKIGDGAPVTIMAPGAAPGPTPPAAPAGKGQ
jgi:RND family efflux transporter MFP subunit